jgi:hypothetical protein
MLAVSYEQRKELHLTEGLSIKWQHVRRTFLSSLALFVVLSDKKLHEPGNVRVT